MYTTQICEMAFPAGCFVKGFKNNDAFKAFISAKQIHVWITVYTVNMLTKIV